MLSPCFAASIQLIDGQSFLVNQPWRSLAPILPLPRLSSDQDCTNILLLVLYYIIILLLSSVWLGRVTRIFPDLTPFSGVLICYQMSIRVSFMPICSFSSAPAGYKSWSWDSAGGQPAATTCSRLSRFQQLIISCLICLVRKGFRVEERPIIVADREVRHDTTRRALSTRVEGTCIGSTYHSRRETRVPEHCKQTHTGTGRRRTEKALGSTYFYN